MANDFQNCVVKIRDKNIPAGFLQRPGLNITETRHALLTLQLISYFYIYCDIVYQIISWFLRDLRTKHQPVNRLERSYPPSVTHKL